MRTTTITHLKLFSNFYSTLSNKMYFISKTKAAHQSRYDQVPLVLQDHGVDCHHLQGHLLPPLLVVPGGFKVVVDMIYSSCLNHYDSFNNMQLLAHRVQSNPITFSCFP